VGSFGVLEEVDDLLCHVDPRDKDAASEEQRQLAFLKLAKMRAPSLLIWATPNAGRRTRWEVGKAKREGMVSGAPDLTVAWNYGTAWLEFKNGTDKPSDNQRDFLNRLHRAGHRVAVVRTAESALACLQAWGAPVR